MTELRRTLGLTDAVVVGAGSMIGAGVFVAWAPAAREAGSALLIGLVVAAVVAWCNATSSAQLAARHPESGGTYVYGRHRLGPGWGHLAGWGFVVGKTASCVAMALAIGAYVWPAQERAVAVLAIVAITAVNLGGLSRTVAVTKVLLGVSIAALAVVVVSGWTADDLDPGRVEPAGGSVLEVLRSAGFLFFAFAGYARIATLGEEVRDPSVTIPKAVPRALAAVLAVYAVVGVTTLVAVPVETIARSGAPLVAVVEAGRFDSAAPLVRAGATVASLGVLLNLIPGISRTGLAMARRRELPGWFAVVDRRRALPVRAELAVAAIAAAGVLVLDLRNAIGVSGVAVLTYYAITNAAALRLAAEERRWPRWIAGLGLVGCIALVVCLPPAAVVSGMAVLAAGAFVRLITARAAAPAG